MAVNVNLLPPELSVSKSLSNLLKTLRALGVIGIAAFLVFAVGVGVFYVISTISLNNLNTNLKTLESQITAQQTSEQQIILLKDRLSKISQAQKQANSLPNLLVVRPFLDNLTGATISQMQVDTTGVDLSLAIAVNPSLTSFISSLEKSTAFKNVTLSSFSLNPVIGYSVEVKIVGK